MNTKPRCRCKCGYKCGGPGVCKLGILECLKQEKGHFEEDCGHDWTGPEWVSEDRSMSSVTCVACGAPKIVHDMNVGP